MEPEAQDEHKHRKWPLILLCSAIVLGGGGWFAYSHTNGQSGATPAKIQVPSQSHKTRSSGADRVIDSASSSTSKDKQAKAADKLVGELLGGTDGTSGVDAVLNAVIDPVGTLAKAVSSDATKEFVVMAAKALTEADVKTDQPSDEQALVDDTTGGAALTPLDHATGNTGDAGSLLETNTSPSNGESTPTDTNAGDGTTTTPVKVDRAPVLLALGSLRFHAKQDYMNYLSGVAARDVEDGNLINGVRVDTTAVDANTPGSYWATYSVTDSAGHTVSVKREIVIYNDKPALYVTQPQMTIEVGSIFDAMKGVVARDFQDGDLTDRVAISGSVNTSNPGTYNLTYEIGDANGTTATAKRKVIVYADKPTLDLSKIPTTIKVGDPINVHDITAASKYGGVSVELVGNVDPDTPGQYPLTYTVTNKYRQQTTTSITVTVQATTTDTLTSDATDTLEPTINVADSSAVGSSETVVK